MAKWYTIVPIIPSYNSQKVLITKPIDLGHNVLFTIVPNWLNKPIGFDNLSFYQRQRIEDAQYMLVSEYEADCLGEPDLEWKGKQLRSKQEMALERIIIANLALWLTKPSYLGFELVLHIQEQNKGKGDKILRESFSTPPLKPHINDQDNYLEIKELEQSRKVNLSLQGLERTNSVWIAVWTLREALTSDLWQIRFLLLWIVLEALFGTDIEIAYRISQRICFFLSSSREKALELFKAAKISYRWRSKIVHGMRLDKSDQKKSERILYNTEDFVRTSLNKIINDAELIKIFSNNKERERYLDNLVFLVHGI